MKLIRTVGLSLVSDLFRFDTQQNICWIGVESMEFVRIGNTGIGSIYSIVALIGKEQRHPARLRDYHQFEETYKIHTKNDVSLEASQVSEQHTGTSGRYYAAKVHR